MGRVSVADGAERELSELIGEMCLLKARAGAVAEQLGEDQKQFVEYLADILIYELAVMKSLAKAREAELVCLS